MAVEIYKKIPNKPRKHGWAFYYFLKNNGDNPKVVKEYDDGSIDIKIEVDRS